MKKPVDDDNLVTMLGFDGYIWAGSLNGNVYAFRMDNYELYKTYTGHRASVWCLCSMLDTYVVSGSAQNDTSIAIWENVQPPNLGMRSSSAPSATTTTPTAKGTTFNLQGTSDTSGSPKKRDTKNVKKPIDIL
jgi:WD40 repeat protein